MLNCFVSNLPMKALSKRQATFIFQRVKKILHGEESVRNSIETFQYFHNIDRKLQYLNSEALINFTET